MKIHEAVEAMMAGAEMVADATGRVRYRISRDRLDEYQLQQNIGTGWTRSSISVRLAASEWSVLEKQRPATLGEFIYRQMESDRDAHTWEEESPMLRESYESIARAVVEEVLVRGLR
jgi:hypothetical protein